MAKIKMKNSVTVAETFHDFLVGKKAAGVSEEAEREIDELIERFKMAIED